jgi:hypothetical protein
VSELTKYLHDGSSEYCVCGHNVKDHETRYWEAARNIHFEEGYGWRGEIHKGFTVICWGKNTGGVNCIK